MPSNFSKDFKNFFIDFATWMEYIELIPNWDKLSYVLNEDCPKLDSLDDSPRLIEAYDCWMFDNRATKDILLTNLPYEIRKRMITKKHDIDIMDVL